jgi:hypothetical protein
MPDPFVSRLAWDVQKLFEIDWEFYAGTDPLPPSSVPNIGSRIISSPWVALFPQIPEPALEPTIKGITTLHRPIINENFRLAHPRHH